MKRAGDLKLEESELAWKYQNNTVIISYDKPDKVLEIEKKKKEELHKMGKSSDYPMIGGGGGASSTANSSSDVKSLLGGPSGGGQRLPEGQECKQ